MSLVLAPIHELMYQKVLRQNGMAEELLKTAEEEQWTQTLRMQVDRDVPAAPIGTLAEIIDTANIHGWLNNIVVQSERRLACVTAGILENHSERLNVLCDRLCKLGEQQAIPQGLSAEDVFMRLNNALLDGMPCDRSLEITLTEPEQVKWVTLLCSHSAYWQELGLSFELYYTLRDAWIYGALAQSGYSYKRNALEHQLYKVE